jgi:hypothetical protein
VGDVGFEVGEREAVAQITGGSLRRDAHAFGLLLVDAATGLPIPLSYAFVTAVEADAEGRVRAVRVRYEPGTLRDPVRAHYLIDVTPVASATLSPALGSAAPTR